jgi:TrpR-related protein YerC/YecD
MSRFPLRKLSPKKQRELLEGFFLTIASLKNIQEVRRFFKDLLEIDETAMLARRLQAAIRLLAGKTYQEISQELKMGMDTIDRVNRWLKHGSQGYRIAVERLKRKKLEEEKKK